MRRGWPAAVIASAALLAGCAGGGLTRTEQDGLDYATAKYDRYVEALGRPRFPLMLRWYVQASCRAANQEYPVQHRNAFAAAFARRVHGTAQVRGFCLRGFGLA